MIRGLPEVTQSLHNLNPIEEGGNYMGFIEWLVRYLGTHKIFTTLVVTAILVLVGLLNGSLNFDKFKKGAQK